MNIPIADTLLKDYICYTPLKITCPLPFFDWTDFFKACKAFFGSNFYQFIIFLAGWLSAFQYQRILEVVDKDKQRLVDHHKKTIHIVEHDFKHKLYNIIILFNHYPWRVF